MWTFSLCVTQRGVLGPETPSVGSKQLHPSSNCLPACPPSMSVAFLVAQWHTSSRRKKGPMMKNAFQPCGRGNHLKHVWDKSNPLRLKKAQTPASSHFSIDSDYKVGVRCVWLLSYCWNDLWMLAVLSAMLVSASWAPFAYQIVSFWHLRDTNKFVSVF